eukprot:75372-Prorocentrum_minimum.AAC.1
MYQGKTNYLARGARRVRVIPPHVYHPPNRLRDHELDVGGGVNNVVGGHRCWHPAGEVLQAHTPGAAVDSAGAAGLSNRADGAHGERAVDEGGEVVTIRHAEVERVHPGDGGVEGAPGHAHLRRKDKRKENK